MNTQFPELGTVIGRDSEISELHDLISHNRLTTIVGTGGIGKTTVAVAAAQLFVDEEGGSVIFVDLSSIAGEEFVIPSLATVLGINNGSQDRLDAICSILAGRRALILFDTCEHVISAVALLCDVILAQTEHVRILATSRQAVRAKNEEVFRLSPLHVPSTNQALTAEQVLEYSAPQLLIERISTGDTYRLDDRDAWAIAEICRRLDGLPLAIELISSRLATNSPADVLGELDDRFSNLLDRGYGGPERQHTLLATLEWSYALLTKNEAAVLRASSIFVGQFDIAAVLRVLAHHNLDASSIFDAVLGLRTKSMLIIEQASNHIRYRLLDSTRAFAGNLLEASGELGIVSGAYARYVLEAVEVASLERKRLPARQWHATYAGLVVELRAAINWTLYLHKNSFLGLQLVAAGLPVWDELSLYEEAHSNCDEALAEFDRIGCEDKALKLKLIVGLAAVTSYLSADSKKAVETFEAAIRLSREIGDTQAECHALIALARYQLLPGYQTAARKTLSELRRIALKSGNRWAEWEHETLLGEVEIIDSDYPSVIARMERLRVDLQGVSGQTASRFDIDLKIRTDNTLGAVQWLGSCKPGTALAGIQKAAISTLEAHHGWTLIYCFTRGVIFILSECQEYVFAKHCTVKLIEAIYDHGMPSWIPVANCYAQAIDALCGKRSDPDGLMAAYEGLRAGLPQHGRHVYYALLIRALNEIGSVDEATDILDYVFDIGPQRSMLPELLRLRAVKERIIGRHDDALATLNKALITAEENGAWAWRLRVATDLSIILRDRLQFDAAKKALDGVYSHFIDGFDTPDLRRAKDVLTELNRLGTIMIS